MASAVPVTRATTAPSAADVDARTGRCGQGSRLALHGSGAHSFPHPAVCYVRKGEETQRLLAASLVVREETRDDATPKS